MNISNELRKIGWFPGRKSELSWYSDRKIELGWYSDVKIQFDEFNNTDIPLKIRMFIENFGGLEYFNQNHDAFSFSKKTLKFIINNSEAYIVGWINSGILGTLRLYMTENENFYILEYNRKIADNIEGFLYKMFSDSLDLSVKISENFFEEMRNSGWYPGRKVDISHFINILKENNYIISGSVINFYSQFYNLQEKNENFEWKIFNENNILEYYGDYKRYLKILSQNPYIQKLSLFPIGIVDLCYDLFEYYITEDEKVINQYGTLVGNNFLEGINSMVRIYIDNLNAF